MSSSKADRSENRNSFVGPIQFPPHSIIIHSKSSCSYDVEEREEIVISTPSHKMLDTSYSFGNESKYSINGCNNIDESELDSQNQNSECKLWGRSSQLITNDHESFDIEESKDTEESEHDHGILFRTSSSYNSDVEDYEMTRIESNYQIGSISNQAVFRRYDATQHQYSQNNNIDNLEEGRKKRHVIEKSSSFPDLSQDSSLYRESTNRRTRRFGIFQQENREKLMESYNQSEEAKHASFWNKWRRNDQSFKALRRSKYAPPNIDVSLKTSEPMITSTCPVQSIAFRKNEPIRNIEKNKTIRKKLSTIHGNIERSQQPYHRNLHRVDSSVTEYDKNIFNQCAVFASSACVCVYDVLPAPSSVSVADISLNHPMDLHHDDDGDEDDTSNSSQDVAKTVYSTRSGRSDNTVRSINSTGSIKDIESCNVKRVEGNLNKIENEQNDYACYDIPVYSDVMSCSGSRKPFQVRRKLKKGYRYSKNAFMRTKIGFHFYSMNKRRFKTLMLILMTPIWTAFWTYSYMILEDWTFVESLYFIIQAFTTLGFGDYLPVTDVGMAVFPVASIGGITLTAAAVSNIGLYMCNNLNWVKIKSILFLFFFIINLASGLFMYLEDWELGESLFFLYSCASTTGLSEEVPVTSAGRIAFCLLMMIFFSLFSTLIRLIVDHLRKGSDAEVVEAGEMSRSVLIKFVKNVFDDD